MAMGLNELSLCDWIEIDSEYPRQLARKRELLSLRHSEVFCALPDMEDAASEVLEILAEHLALTFPQYFKRVGSSFQNLINSENWDLAKSGLHPLDLASRLVQEDLCLMSARDDSYVLAAASVCFPSRWKLSDKIGRPMQDIHAPVPFYGEKIGATTDRFMSTLRAARAVWRMNWTLHDTPELFQPASPPAGSERITPVNAGEKLWIRVERQTLRRLPNSGDALFTIRTHVRPLATLKNNPQSASQLASTLRNLPAETTAYKSLAPNIEAVLQWLER